MSSSMRDQVKNQIIINTILSGRKIHSMTLHPATFLHPRKTPMTSPAPLPTKCSPRIDYMSSCKMAFTVVHQSNMQKRPVNIHR